MTASLVGWVSPHPCTSIRKPPQMSSITLHLASVKSGYDMNLEPPPHLNGLASQQAHGLHLSPPSSTGALGVPYSHPTCSSLCLWLLCLIHTPLAPLCVCGCWKLNSGLHVHQVIDPLFISPAWRILTIGSETNSYRDSLEVYRGKKVGTEKEGTGFALSSLAWCTETPCSFSLMSHRERPWMIIISKIVEERGDEKENIMNPQKSGKEERET